MGSTMMFVGEETHAFVQEGSAKTLKWLPFFIATWAPDCMASELSSHPSTADVHFVVAR
jgi:hypothetical protein